MCLVALALAQSRRFPLVLASNRDEFLDRPATGLDWWQPPEGGPPLLSGRDLKAGGTWLGLSAAGRLGFVTNVRAPAALRPQAPSRGALVPRWLRGDLGFEAYWRATHGAGYDGFNLIAADMARGDWYWASNSGGAPRRLDHGVYGVSNAALDTPWPKTERLKERLSAAVAATIEAEPAEALAARLFEALADRRLADDAELPATGIALDWERQLSATFIRTPDGRYGTRCSTVVIVERRAGRSVAHVLERGFDDGAAPTRHVRLPDWPPIAAVERAP